MNENSLKNLEKGKRTRIESGDKAAKSGSKGGIASGESRRRKKTMAEMVNIMLTSKLSNDQADELKETFGDIEAEDMTMQAKIIAGQFKSAAKGNTAAFNAIMSIQEKEKAAAEKKESKGKVFHIDLDKIADNFHSVIREIRSGKYSEYVFRGGRGSAKSSCVSQIIVEIMKNNPMIHALVMRKVYATVKDSVYAQMQWAIEEQAELDDYEFLKSPFEAVMKATGQTIYYRGADKKEKIKSIKPKFGYIGILWFEEVDQFAGEEEIRSITQSAIRGGDLTFIFMSYNPPKQKSNWINKYVMVPKPGMKVHTSSYLDVPPEWLGKAFIEEAEKTKALNPEAYEHEYMGVPNGEGGLVFPYVEVRTITDEEIQGFDRIYQGVDWGLAPDPYAFIRLHYDPMRETIYLIREYVVRGALNRQTGQYLIDNQLTDYMITCDSAEKKSTLDYRDMGISAKNAVKGPGSVEYGMKWLSGRKIVIDPVRTPVAFKEFTEYEFERDKEGNLVTGYPDKDNHTIDAVRYALEKYSNQRYSHA